VDLQAIRACDADLIAAAAAAAAENASDLVDGAEVLARSRHGAQACSLAALATEESGKAIGLTALAGMPQSVRARAPLGRMLGWHALKQVTGQLVAVIAVRPSAIAATLLDLPEDDVDEVLIEAGDDAEEADRLRRAGMYVDISRAGIRAPEQVTGAEVADRLARARQAAAATTVLQDHRERALISDPSDNVKALTKSAVDAITTADQSRRTPKGAAQVIDRTVRGLITGTV
jgi:AbiV family abortive infection protein